MRKLVAVLAAAAATLAVVAPVGASGAKTVVSVRLKEWGVLPTPVKTKHGVVAFSVKNIGKLDHELVVLKTNIAPTKLPVKNAKAAEPGRVGRVGPLKPGTSRTLVLTLKPGNYVLICNVLGHYKAGQRIGFKVT